MPWDDRHDCWVDEDDEELVEAEDSCPSCGAEVYPDADFCPFCGEEL